MSETSVKKQPCEPRVAIYPVRYTVIERNQVDPNYAYQNAGLDLQTGYPTLKHSQYTMRLLTEGFVYLYDETKDSLLLWKITEQGAFIELIAKTATLENLEKLYKTGDTQQFLWAPKDSTVHIGFTDSLWTNKTYAAISKNTDNIRDKLMTKVNVKSWVVSQKNKHCFIPDQLGQLVEEFKDKKWQENLKWSQRETTPAFNTVSAMANAMKSYAPIGQIITALHDNIGMVEDQKMLMKKQNDKLLNYTVEHHRKKIIAELIEQVYTTSYAKEKELSSKAKIEVAVAEDITKRKKLYASERENFKKGRIPNYRLNYTEKLLRNEPKTNDGYRSEVLANVAKRDKKHINEIERSKFLEQFNMNTIRLSTIHMESKNDRCKLLKSYVNSNRHVDLGSSFLNYDIDNPISGGAHAQAFASCIDGMMADVRKVESISNCEQDLFNEWWRKSKPDNPLLVNLKLDDNLLTYALENKQDTAADLVSITAEGLDGALRPFFASTVITQNITVYTLTKSPKWNGAVLNNIDEMFKNMTNAPSIENAKELRTILTGQHQKLTGKYKDNVTIKHLSPKDALRHIGKAAKLSDHQVERILNSRGSLKGKDIAAITITHVADEEKLKSGLENPYGGRIGLSISGLVLVMYAVNLKSAIDTMQNDKVLISVPNLASAMLGLGSGINGAIQGMRPILGTQSYNKLIQQSKIIRMFAEKGAIRLFGYGGAIFDGLTYAMRSYSSGTAGNSEAATYYAFSSIFFTTGGIAATKVALVAAGASSSIPVAGWIVAGIILLGIGLYLAILGDDAQFTPMDKWLDNSSFGLHGIPNSINYKTEAKEQDGFIEAMYAPQLLSSSWDHEKFGSKENATIEIFQPIKDQYYRFGVTTDGSIPKMDTTIYKKERVAEMWPINPEKMQITVEYDDNVNNGVKSTLNFTGLPHGTKELTICIFYIPLITGEEGHWIKSIIKVKPKFLWGSSHNIKAIR